MIASLSGKVLAKGEDRAVVDVGGVGYEVILASDAVARLPEKGREVFLHIHTSVREDAITLYGFPEEEEKELYLLLRTVNGIGPKLALAMLSGMRVAELARSIAAADVKRLTMLPGVGKRIAERLSVELKEKVAHLGSAGTIAAVGGAVTVALAAGSTAADVLSAMGNLGYPEAVSRRALETVRRRMGDEVFERLGFDQLMRETLRSLA
jgi:Holliday junction DNA helicase RuvA